ncbi:MAG TPA: FKBP-type peptidyl-prolyl cis-trans isomerase, partial [Chitinophagaceae bacterium]
TQDCSGMFYDITNPGTGPQPGACTGVKVKYTGRLTNGNVFDQETTNGISIGLDQVIRAWRIGIPLLKVGGTATLYIPPSLGYGSQDLRDQSGAVVIPGNSILIFTVELTAVY